MKKVLPIILYFVFLSFLAKGQDTITFMQYNLLNYGNFTSYCTSSNNNVARKTGYISTIVHYVKPDILTVNEMTGIRSYHDYLLNNGLNTDGVTEYVKASDTLAPKDAYLVNVLYYNKNKLGEASHVVAQTYIRDVDIFKLYYKSPDLNEGADTTFIYCVVAHLKAGIDDQNARKVMATNTMNYIAAHDPDENYLLMGDFNVYTDQEPAFQEFINYKNEAIRFHDPVDAVGDWHNNASYALYQSQSTHSYTSGCPAGGGLDDRFDFILISNNVKNGTKKVKYVPGSFHVVGQDGKHFNKALLDDPENTTVPSNVLNALYYNSDHLPVTLKVSVDQPTAAGIRQIPSDISELKFSNPVKDVLNFSVHASKPLSLKVEVFSLVGKKVMQEQFSLSQGFSRQTMDVSDLPKGLYILRFTESNGASFSRKLLKY
ncbi:T9SS type A sorting domain-containing protein [Candidatus Sulfidibacterium hydrothermale]|uniref:T9SS type A sorting domain-containing protein n=1 Tax=Candidatus Sulfidibacterium hydrothermale TaxID=2875962 RepID=UPI001F0B5AC6|nr:T9SS type A sorting domain-containing protein [Candidatus Sulfidibacterium hydrothermale]UBM62243.1 T9SS type A sorting domain-containing protein [Candidatus Sulfidibacterium hydrothermale]